MAATKARTGLKTGHYIRRDEASPASEGGRYKAEEKPRGRGHLKVAATKARREWRRLRS